MRFDAAGNPVYYLEDAMGSAVGTLDHGSASVSTVTYDAFGNVRGTTGAGLGGASAGGGEFGFHGAWREAATGLYHMHARDYDPQTGRFTSRDPVRGADRAPESFHPYAFGYSNPHVYTDPNGRFSISEISASSAVDTALNALQTGG
jgi:RHS repeat-associated protein